MEDTKFMIKTFTEFYSLNPDDKIELPQKFLHSYIEDKLESLNINNNVIHYTIRNKFKHIKEDGNFYRVFLLSRNDIDKEIALFLMKDNI